MSGLIAYWLAWQYTQHVVDRSLADLATAISKQIQIAGPKRRSPSRRSPRRCSPIPVEHLIYRISDGETRNRRRPDAAAARHAACARMHYAYVFETQYQGMTCARRASARRSADRQSDRRRSRRSRCSTALSHRRRIPGRDHDAAAAAAARGLGDRVARRQSAAQSADRSRRLAQPADAHLARAGRRNAMSRSKSGR